MISQASEKIDDQAPCRLHHSRLASLYRDPIRPIISVIVTENSVIISGMPKVPSAMALFRIGCARGSGSSARPTSSSRVPAASAPIAHRKWPAPSISSAREMSGRGRWRRSRCSSARLMA